MSRPTFIGAGALLLVACGEPAVNSTSQVEIRVVNSTDLADVVVTVSWVSNDGTGSSTQTFLTPNQPMTVPTGVNTAGEPLQFHVVAGEETTDHTCHVHADAIGNEDNVPTAVIYREPLRVVCQSGWQEEEARRLGGL
jgi:hypothetical protein